MDPFVTQNQNVDSIDTTQNEKPTVLCTAAQYQIVIVRETAPLVLLQVQSPPLARALLQSLLQSPPLAQALDVLVQSISNEGYCLREAE